MTSIIIDSKNSGTNKTISKSLNYVNSEATDDKLYQMAVYFNAISVNTFVGVSRIDKRTLSAEGTNNG